MDDGELLIPTTAKPEECEIAQKTFMGLVQLFVPRERKSTDFRPQKVSPLTPASSVR